MSTFRRFMQDAVIALEEYSDIELEEIWQKAEIISDNYEDRRIRLDPFGALIKFSAHGDHNDDMGWDVDHANPTSKGGKDDMANLRPMHFSNNRARQDDDTKFIPVVSDEKREKNIFSHREPPPASN